jgi:hypothetical protein
MWHPSHEADNIGITVAPQTAIAAALVVMPDDHVPESGRLRRLAFGLQAVQF